MSVSLVSSPASLMSIDDIIQWKLSISDLGTAGVDKKTIGYQLALSGGSDITDILEKNPANTAIQPNVSFMSEMKALLKTLPPELFNTSMQDAQGVLDFVLKYDELTTTFSTGLTTPTSLGGSSASVKVVNSTVYNYFNHMDSASSYMMTYKSKVQKYYRQSFDWIYVFGAGSVTIKIGNTTLASITGAAGKINCIPIGAMHYPTLKSASSYNVRVTATNFDETYYFFNCGDVKDGEPHQIVYKDPAGGYTALNCTLINQGVTVSKDKINTYKRGGSSVSTNQYNTTEGFSLINAVAYPQFTFQYKNEMTPDVIEVLTRFLSAESYYIILKTRYYEGLIKFEVNDSSDIKRDIDTEFQFSGKLINPINNPNGVI